MSSPKPPCILYVGSFPPRECGIATFTQRLTNAIDKEYSPEVKSKILAINYNGTSIYNYPRKVIMQINETEIEDYLDRANEINKRADIKLVNIQHEYGLFGGEQGEFIIPFLELIKKPIIITMHTVIPNPDEKMKKVAQLMAERAEGIIVMNKIAREILSKNYDIKINKIKVIPHGVFHIPFPSKVRSKKKLNLNGRLVVSTFGMISKDKGIEYAIEALPAVVEKHPEVLYLIIGATHPQVLKEEGEKYRNKLKGLIKKYKLENNVKFYNKYLTEAEVVDFLKATDIYVYPMLNREQASSGSLSDAMSCACPSIATSSQYAKSVINQERGILVRFKNAKDIEKALLDLIADKKMRKEMTKNTYFYTRHMTWQNVALSYFKEFNHHAKILPKRKDKLPEVTLAYIKNLTDEFGMIQFANHTKPDLTSGYCLDDNARALIGCSLAYSHKKIKSTLELIELYLNFIKFTQKENGRFYNFVNYSKEFNDKGESEDSFGRAIWALGVVIKNPDLPKKIIDKAKEIYSKSHQYIPQLHSLRSIAFTLIGLCHLAEVSENKKEKDLIISYINDLSQKLINKFEEHVNEQKDNWDWFENCLTYSNYKLSESLFYAYKITGNEVYKKIAKLSIDFLIKVTFERRDYFLPIGQDGWYFRNGKRSYFDQQPEDTASAVEALVTAYKITKDKNYFSKAKVAFAWFLGKNHLNQMVYDEATGGCYDGLGKYSLNFNQGAESSLSYFLARLVIEEL